MLESSNCRYTPVIRFILLNTLDYPGTSFVNEEPENQKSTQFDLSPNCAPSIDSIPGFFPEVYPPNRPSFSAAYRNFRKEINLVELGLDPDELFAGAREETEGRDIQF